MWSQARYACLIRAPWSNHFLLLVEVWVNTICLFFKCRSLGFLSLLCWRGHFQDRSAPPGLWIHTETTTGYFTKASRGKAARVTSPNRQWSWQHRAPAPIWPPQIYNLETITKHSEVENNEIHLHKYFFLHCVWLIWLDIWLACEGLKRCTNRTAQIL